MIKSKSEIDHVQENCMDTCKIDIRRREGRVAMCVI